MTLKRWRWQHFICHNHNGLINDIEIILIDKTDPSDPTRRKEFWWAKLKTLAPGGLNTEEWVFSYFIIIFSFSIVLALVLALLLVLAFVYYSYFTY